MLTAQVLRIVQNPRFSRWRISGIIARPHCWSISSIPDIVHGKYRGNASIYGFDEDVQIPDIRQAKDRGNRPVRARRSRSRSRGEAQSLARAPSSWRVPPSTHDLAHSPLIAILWLARHRPSPLLLPPLPPPSLPPSSPRRCIPNDPNSPRFGANPPAPREGLHALAVQLTLLPHP